MAVDALKYACCQQILEITRNPQSAISAADVCVGAYDGLINWCVFI